MRRALRVFHLASNLPPPTSALEAAYSASAANPPSATAKSEIENLKSKIGCASCADKFWEGVKLLWFEQAAVVLLCEDCLVEPGKPKETGEEFDDSAVLPGQMETWPWSNVTHEPRRARRGHAVVLDAFVGSDYPKSRTHCLGVRYLSNPSARTNVSGNGRRSSARGSTLMASPP